MSPPTNQHPPFYRPDALPVAQLYQSTEGKLHATCNFGSLFPEITPGLTKFFKGFSKKNLWDYWFDNFYRQMLRLSFNEQRRSHEEIRLRCAIGCVVECRTCNQEVEGSNFDCGYFAPRSTQPSITPGSVNEYQLRLGRKRQVWLVLLADKTR